MCRFLKAISDENRLTILKQLSIKPSYGQEIAGKLKLTPATVKHHLAMLEEMNLITASKSEHKIYYNINYAVITQGFEDVRNYLM